jgi:hypothetical protein
MNPSNPFSEKPGLFNAILVMTLVSGIVNVFWGIAASAAAMHTVIGIVCVPISILPTVLGIFEILYAARLLSTSPSPVQPSTTIAALEIACIVVGNVFAMVVGILSLVFYNDAAVKDYFARLNGAPGTTRPVPAPEPPAAPPVPHEPGAGPVG